MPRPEDDSGESNDRRLPLRLVRRTLEIVAERGLDRAGIEIAEAARTAVSVRTASQPLR